MSRNILILQTGGTVCSNAKNSDISLSKTAHTDLLHLYTEAYGQTEQFTVKSPFYMLSEDSTPAKIGALLKAIAEAVLEPWDGIIILHGTDTLPYSAAAVGMCFGNAGKSIVFSSANITPDQPGSNALPNFRNAILCIQNQMQGVFCTYRNSCGTDYVFLGTRLAMADGFSDDFSDYFHEPYAVIKEGEVHRNPQCRGASDDCDLSSWTFLFDKNVCLLTPYPGLQYPEVLRGDVAAVLHLTYHSGTACTTEGYDAADFVKECVKKGIPFYLAPLKGGKKTYSTTGKILSSGAKPLYDISPVAAYVKLLLAYNQSAISPDAFISKNYYFETVE